MQEKIDRFKAELEASEKARQYWLTESKKRKQGEEWLQTELDKYRWIPVEERLPELIENISNPHSKDVWAIFDNKEPYKAVYSKAKGWFIYASYETSDCYQDKITHWKPIILP